MEGEKYVNSDYERLVTDNENLVKYCAKKVNAPYEMYEDIISVGKLYIVMCAKKYKPELGFKFSSYASQYIMGGMRTYIKKNCSMLKCSAKLIENKNAVFRYMKRNDIESLHDLDAKTIEELGLTHVDIADIQSVNSVLSLSQPAGVDLNGSIITIEDTIADNTYDYKNKIDRDTFECIDDYIKICKSKKGKKKFHADLMKDYCYSAYMGKAIQNKKLAKKYGLSRTYVSKILVEFKADFRKYLEKRMNETL